MANDSWYNNLFDSGTNIWGAGGNGNTQKMIDLGLLEPDARDKAQSQSLMRGLLGAGVSYISQPKNQNYGSALPYIGKAFGQGMEAAQKPFDNLAKTANQNQALKKIEDADKAKLDRTNTLKGLYKTIPGQSTTTKTNAESIYKTGPDGQVSIAPNFGLNSNTQVTPERRVLDQQKLQELMVTDPILAAEVMNNYKTEAEIGKINREGYNTAPETWRAATPAEAEQYGAKNGQISSKGKFAGTDKSGQTVNVSPTINTGTKQEDAVATARTKGYIGLTQLSDEAMEDQLSVTRALNLINTMGPTGFGTTAKATLDKALMAIGLDPANYSPEQLQQREVFESITNKLALGMRKAGSGVMTDKDFAVFKSMVGGLENFEQANAAILGYRDLINKRRGEIAVKARAYRRSQTSFLKDENGNVVAKKAHSLDAGYDEFLYEEQKQTQRELEKFISRHEGKRGTTHEAPDGTTYTIENEIPL